MHGASIAEQAFEWEKLGPPLIYLCFPLGFHVEYLKGLSEAHWRNAAWVWSLDSTACGHLGAGVEFQVE